MKKIIFENNEYKPNARNGLALKYFVLVVVKKYMSEHPNLSYKELQNFFSLFNLGKKKMIFNEADYNEWNDRKEKRPRYFPAFIHKGELIYVLSEWGDIKNGNLGTFIEFAEDRLNHIVEIKEYRL